jgi:hypothetical protein
MVARPSTAHAAAASPLQRPSTASGGLVPRAEFTPNSGSASQQMRARSATNTSPKRPDKPALASMLRPMSSGVRGNSSDALKSQFQFLKDQEMTIDPTDACAMLFKLGAQFVSAITALESELSESKSGAAHAIRESASLRQDLVSKENLLSAYNKLDFIKSSMSVSVLQTSINNIGAPLLPPFPRYLHCQQPRSPSSSPHILLICRLSHSPPPPREQH